MNAKTFEDLLVWKKAQAYVLEIYRITKEFPRNEIFGLTAQMHTCVPLKSTTRFREGNPFLLLIP
jgi:23S rRNA-intervening sequence protein